MEKEKTTPMVEIEKNDKEKTDQRLKAYILKAKNLVVKRGK